MGLLSGRSPDRIGRVLEIAQDGATAVIIVKGFGYLLLGTISIVLFWALLRGEIQMSQPFMFCIVILACAVILAMYFFPFLMGVHRRVHHPVLLFLFNLCLGWLVVPFFVAGLYALYSEPKAMPVTKSRIRQEPWL